MSDKSLLRHLLGSMEIALFMPQGVKRFCDSTKAMKKSFLIPLMIFPLTILTVLTAHPHDLNASTAQILVAIYGLRLVVYLATFLTVVYFLAKGMGKLEEFKRFVTANNWIMLPAALLSLPLLMMFLNGAYDWGEIYPMMVTIVLYSYAYSAFMATYVLRVPWELAVFIAVIGMGIHQTSLDILKWAAVNAVYLVS